MSKKHCTYYANFRDKFMSGTHLFTALTNFWYVSDNKTDSEPTNGRVKWRETFSNANAEQKQILFQIGHRIVRMVTEAVWGFHLFVLNASIALWREGVIVLISFTHTASCAYYNTVMFNLVTLLLCSQF